MMVPVPSSLRRMRIEVASFSSQADRRRTRGRTRRQSFMGAFLRGRRTRRGPWRPVDAESRGRPSKSKAKFPSLGAKEVGPAGHGEGDPGLLP